ncbi:MAG: nitrile hydratase accessory protein [Candidatus Binataceae bacterium]
MSPERILIPDDPGAAEPVFNSPWEARVFAMAVTLSKSGLFTWEEFRQKLIIAIGRDDASEDYYENWTRALEAILREKSGLSDAQVTTAMASLPDPPHPNKHSHPPDRPLVSFPAKR